MPAKDKYQGFDTIDSQAEDWAVVVPDDNNDLPGGVPKGLYFAAAGNVAMVSKAGNEVVRAVLAGDEIGWRPARILATGTTVAAGNIIALY